MLGYDFCGMSIDDVAGPTWREEWNQSDIDTLRAEVNRRRVYRALGMEASIKTTLETWTERQLWMAAQMEDDPPDIPEYPEFFDLDEGLPDDSLIVHGGKTLRIPEWNETDIEALRETVRMRRAMRMVCPGALGMVKALTALTERQRLYAEQHADDERDSDNPNTANNGQEAAIQ